MNGFEKVRVIDFSDGKWKPILSRSPAGNRRRSSQVFKYRRHCSLWMGLYNIIIQNIGMTSRTRVMPAAGIC